MDIHEAVTTRVKQLCEEKGWTTNELVRRSKVNQSTIAEIMSGRSKYPRIITIEKISKGFGISLSEFFDDEIFQDIDQTNETKKQKSR